MEAVEEGRSSTARAISDGAVQLLRDYTGRGPNKARTTFSTDMVTIVLIDTLTKGEVGRFRPPLPVTPGT